jgi:leader peptidase (prepilin peptidase)/N-methyltransferase
MPMLIVAYAFFVGAIIGSFLNVVIHRYPREESVVFPPSHCPSCNAVIRPYDNVPILSYLMLRGRCRKCRQPISPRYPLVEAANALFYVAIVLRSGVSVLSFVLAALVSMTIVLIYIDLEIQILPDVIDLPGIALGLALGAYAADKSTFGLAPRLVDSVIGAVVGGGVLLTIGFLYERLRHIEGMGLGDVKMLAMIGSVVGWRSLIAVLLIASISGAVVGLGIFATGVRKDLRFALPFGVFLGLAFLAVLFFNDTISAWLPPPFGGF